MIYNNQFKQIIQKQHLMIEILHCHSKIIYKIAKSKHQNSQIFLTQLIHSTLHLNLIKTTYVVKTPKQSNLSNTTDPFYFTPYFNQDNLSSEKAENKIQSNNHIFERDAIKNKYNTGNINKINSSNISLNSNNNSNNIPIAKFNRMNKMNKYTDQSTNSNITLSNNSALTYYHIGNVNISDPNVNYDASDLFPAILKRNQSTTSSDNLYSQYGSEFNYNQINKTLNNNGIVKNINLRRPSTSTAHFNTRGRKFIAQGTLLDKIKEKNYRRDCTPVMLCYQNKHPILNLNQGMKYYQFTKNTKSRINYIENKEKLNIDNFDQVLRRYSNVNLKPSEMAKYLSDHKKIKNHNNEKKVEEIQNLAKYILDNYNIDELLQYADNVI
eukprot:Mrub_04119.p1 GENE.Mrub_04119~~Mrub_04119.p1  ORF type:complete len:413 (+),score=37.69 Mrub_04119:95-1240(+)